MKSKLTKFRTLVLASVFIMLITGCASLAAVLNPPILTDDGKGGIVIVKVTNNETYWYVGYSGDDEGDGFYVNRGQPVTAFSLSSNLPYKRALRDDTKFTVRYRLARKSELDATRGACTPEVRNEDKRSWYIKTVYVSNDETVEVTIP